MLPPPLPPASITSAYPLPTFSSPFGARANGPCRGAALLHPSSARSILRLSLVAAQHAAPARPPSLYYVRVASTNVPAPRLALARTALVEVQHCCTPAWRDRSCVSLVAAQHDAPAHPPSLYYVPAASTNVQLPVLCSRQRPL